TLGFDGKTLIHPNQIEAANVAFSPSDEEIAYAKSLVEAATKGAANHKGAMVEDLHLRHAQRVLSMTKA
ncbi:MAG: HpcH/HpaI aldolase/citrate lyase family protein, partial [Rickettsiales bacterium]